MNTYELPTSTIEKRTPYTSLIVEPRKHRALHFVLSNFLENLKAEDWSIVLLHETKNGEYVQDIIRKIPYGEKRIQTVNIGVENLSMFEYSDLFFNPRFYDYIPTEMFLIFQTDTMILPENRDKIYKYMKYDYVGASWAMYSKYPYQNGNGGFSLRRKSKMLELLEHQNDANLKNHIDMANNCYTEDVFFSGIFQENISMNKSGYVEACEFVVESVYGDTPFGIHSVWKYMEPYERMIREYPYIIELQKLQSWEPF